MYAITLGDGTKIDNLDLNGNNFISGEILPDEVFDGKLSRVEISGEEGAREFADMYLVANRVMNGKSWFILAEKTDEMKQRERLEQLESEKKLLCAQVQALSDRNEFMEDCIAEMAASVYA